MPSKLLLQQTGKSAHAALIDVGWQARAEKGSPHLCDRWRVGTSIRESVQQWTLEGSVRGHAAAMLHIAGPWQCRRQLCLRFTQQECQILDTVRLVRHFLIVATVLNSPYQKPAAAGREDSPVLPYRSGYDQCVAPINALLSRTSIFLVRSPYR